MPAAPAATPPPKPAVAPKPAAQPAPAPAKAPMVIPPDPVPPAAERFADAFSELRSLASATPDAPPKAPAPPPVKPAEAKKADEKPVSPTPPKEPETPAKPEDKPAEGSTAPDAQFQTAKQVREWGNSLHKENQRLKQEIEAAKSKKPDDGEIKTYKERLEAIEKRKAELENELKFVSYEKTDEYKEKYFQPIVDALATARAEISELTIEDASGNQRKATPEDFDPLTNMPLAQASALAREMFGDLAPEVMAHRRRILELNRARQDAIENYRKHGAEREQQTTAQRQASMKAAKEAFDAANKDAIEQFPQFFAPADGDDEANEALSKGFALVDLAFRNDPSLSPEDRAKIHSDVRNRAAGFSRQVLLNKRKDERIAELEKKLAEFEASEPKGGDGGRTEDAKPESAFEELSRLAKQGG